MKPRHLRILVPTGLIVLALTVSASAANAAIQYEWHVAGSPLKAGTTKELTGKAASEKPLHLTMFYSGVLTTLTSTGLKLTEQINGGKPGQGKFGHITFENVTVQKPKNCEIVGKKIESQVLLESEIVESAQELNGKKEGTGKPELLITSGPGGGSGKLWAEGIKFQNVGEAECVWTGSSFTIGGELLAEILPQKAEAKVGHLVLGPENGRYKNSAGTFKQAQMESGPVAWKITGEPETELVSKEAFGAF